MRNFSTITRSHTAEATRHGLEIDRQASAVLERVEVTAALRLVGVSVSDLGRPEAGQLSPLAPDPLRRERLAGALDRLTPRFGEGR